MNEVSFKLAKLILIMSAASLAIISHNAFAQDAAGEQGIEPPPSIETNSPGGVDMTSGAFSTSSVDLQIGEGAFPNGLSLQRSYNSRTNGFHSGYAYNAQGWSHNWVMRVINSRHLNFAEVTDGIRQPHEPYSPYGGPTDDPNIDRTDTTNAAANAFYHSVVISNGSAKFENDIALQDDRNRIARDRYLLRHVSAANLLGIYRPIEDHNRNQKLEYIGNEADPRVHNSGHYEFTDSDGTLYVFHALDDYASGFLSHVIAPNGVRADITYQNNAVKSVMTSNGYALLFEHTGVANNRHISKACVLNMTEHAINATSNCPAGVQSVTYGYGKATLNFENRGVEQGGSGQIPALISASNALNETTHYEYDDGGHVACIKDPGQSQCRVKIIYSKCNRPAEGEWRPGQRPEGLHLPEPVLSQVLATGESYNYTFPAQDICHPDPVSGDSIVSSSYTNGTGSAGLKTSYRMEGYKPKKITDPLGQETVAEYNGDVDIFAARGAGRLTSQTSPEGQRQELFYDDRSNVIESRLLPKPGSSDRVLTSKAQYPDDCTPTTRKICNKPTQTTDAKGNVTTYTYAPEHGGILSVKGPAVNGVRPETRYTYTQRYAWYKNTRGSFVRSANAIWLLTSERTCTNSNMTATGCAGGAAQSVVTTYDYGPSSGPNNLLLRGTAVTSGGKTLRTCYGYDAYGRRISETQPKGVGGACP